MFTPSRYRINPRINNIPISIGIQQIEEIKSYLVNPASVGIWSLETLQHKSVPIIDEIIEVFKQEKRSFAFRESLSSDFRDIYTILHIFQWLNSNKKLNNYIYNNNPSYFFRSVLYRFSDPSVKSLKAQLKKKYIKQNSFFKKYIYDDKFYTNPRINIIRIKSGICIVHMSDNSQIESEKEEDRLQLTSLNYDPINALQAFLFDLGVINQPELVRTFSPEKDVFLPYMHVLRAFNGTLIKNINVQEKIRKAITEYFEEEYDHCISTIGILTENVLTQIYESLFRNVCPRKLSIKAILNQIDHEVKLVLKTNENGTRRPDEVIKEINTFIISNAKKTKEIGMVNLLRESHLSFMERMGEMNYVIKHYGKTNYTNRIFPPEILDHIEELKQYRNDASHFSTAALGEYESKRAIYCCITLVNWWLAKRASIDWRNNKNDVIKQVLLKDS